MEKSGDSERDFQISPKYKASHWRALQLDAENEGDWLTAIDIVENRIKGRFVRWIDSIVDKKFSGFVVVALDCLLIETLIGFMTGKPSEGPDSLLMGELTKGDLHFTPPEEAEGFREGVRNGIIHDAETRKGWIIRPGDPSGPILAKNGKNTSLNRTAFHQTLTQELGDWLTKLRQGDAELRKNMKNRMDQIISGSSAVE